MMDVHPMCLIVPDMKPGEYADLLASIKRNGLLDPITLYEGMVLDGRHRMRACEEAGVEPRFVAYEGGDPAGFVQGKCAHRNLNPSQRALIAADFLGYEKEQARKRRAAHGNTAPGKKALPEDFPGVSGDSRDKAGERMGVSGKTVEDAAKVLKKAVPEVVEKVRSGQMAINEAKVIVEFTPNAQREIAAAKTKDERREKKLQAQARRDSLKRRNTLAPTTEAQASTQFVRRFLSTLERVYLVCEEDGARDAQSIATRFLSEMDWSAEALVIQLERCDPVIYALNMIRQRAKLAA